MSRIRHVYLVLAINTIVTHTLYTSAIRPNCFVIYGYMNVTHTPRRIGNTHEYNSCCSYAKFDQYTVDLSYQHYSYAVYDFI